MFSLRTSWSILNIHAFNLIFYYLIFIYMLISYIFVQHVSTERYDVSMLSHYRTQTSLERGARSRGRVEVRPATTGRDESTRFIDCRQFTVYILLVKNQYKGGQWTQVASAASLSHTSPGAPITRVVPVHSSHSPVLSRRTGQDFPS